MSTTQLLEQTKQQKPAIEFEAWMRAIRVHAQMKAVAEMELYFEQSDRSAWNEQYDAGQSPEEAWKEEQSNW